jgi:hypothetical protein
VLAQAGERVKHRALAGIGIARQRHHKIPFRHIDAQLQQVAHQVYGAIGAALRWKFL